VGERVRVRTPGSGGPAAAAMKAEAGTGCGHET
jgi:hypothetical protein